MIKAGALGIIDFFLLIESCGKLYKDKTIPTILPTYFKDKNIP